MSTRSAKHQRQWLDPTSRHVGEALMDQALSKLSLEEREILAAVLNDVPLTQLSREIRTMRGLNLVINNIVEQLRSSTNIEDLREQLAQGHVRFSSVLRSTAQRIGVADRLPRCAHAPCARPLGVMAVTGRPRKYCSDRCKQAAYRARKQHDGPVCRTPDLQERQRFPLRDPFAETNHLLHLITGHLSSTPRLTPQERQLIRAVQQAWKLRRHAVPRYPDWVPDRHRAYDFRHPWLHPAWHRQSKFWLGRASRRPWLGSSGGRGSAEVRHVLATGVLAIWPELPPETHSWLRPISPVAPDEIKRDIRAIGAPQWPDFLKRVPFDEKWLLYLANPMHRWIPSLTEPPTVTPLSNRRCLCTNCT